MAAGLDAQAAGPDRQLRGHRLRFWHGVAAAPCTQRPVAGADALDPREEARAPRGHGRRTPAPQADAATRRGRAQGRGRDAQVRRSGRQQCHEPGNPGGRDPGADRPQRRWQNHLLQPADQIPDAGCGRHPLPRPRHHLSCAGADRSPGHRPLIPDIRRVPRLDRAAEHARGADAPAWRRPALLAQPAQR
ncbi:hypothetical protein G6F63_013870 [Rhizopus arrhizus]|nr:hypothetical protein G6F63_013870 [Rhizopus arrhizus]